MPSAALKASQRKRPLAAAIPAPESKRARTQTAQLKRPIGLLNEALASALKRARCDPAADKQATIEASTSTTSLLNDAAAFGGFTMGAPPKNRWLVDDKDNVIPAEWADIVFPDFEEEKAAAAATSTATVAAHMEPMVIDIDAVAEEEEEATYELEAEEAAAEAEQEHKAVSLFGAALAPLALRSTGYWDFAMEVEIPGEVPAKVAAGVAAAALAAAAKSFVPAVAEPLPEPMVVVPMPTCVSQLSAEEVVAAARAEEVRQAVAKFGPEVAGLVGWELFGGLEDEEVEEMELALGEDAIEEDALECC